MDKVTFKGRIQDLTDASVVLTIEPWMKKHLTEWMEKDLKVEIKGFKSDRTLKQNALMWALISEVDVHVNGRASQDGEMAIYKNLIERARIQTLSYEMSSDAYEYTKAQGLFRHIEVLHHDDYYDKMLVRCYLGTSHFDTKQMADFIETLLDYAVEVGMNITEYDELRR